MSTGAAICLSEGTRHRRVPVPMLASDALSRWALDPDPAPPRPGAERSADRAAKRGAA